ncbi:MAG: hypothetical protein ACYC1T_13675 [Sulfuricaulis sp.]
MTTDGKKGHFTFRTAAVLFVISAAWELLSMSSEVALFGEIRGGGGAVVYHIVYAALFLALGIGLWSATKWGYLLVFVTTAVYTLDKLQFLLSRQTMDSYAIQMQAALEPQMPGIDRVFILQVLMLVLILFMLCWWAFALYTWWRRDYFKQDKTETRGNGV